MASDKADTVLRRKTRAAPAKTEARAMTPARGLRLALERAAARALALPVNVTGVERLTADPASLAEMITDGALLMLLEGADGEGCGALALDPALTAALVEAQTTGTMAPGAAAPGARMPTRTDAALCAPVFDTVLGRFAANLADGPDAGWTAGFTTGSMLTAPHALRARLASDSYHVFRASMSLGEAAREGGFVMALPVVDTAAADDEPAAGAGAPDARWQARVLGTRLRLDAVLCRIEMPLSEVLALKPGDVLPIAREALREVTLEPGAAAVTTQARLGQMGGRRALRLTVAPTPGTASEGQQQWTAARLAPDRETSAGPGDGAEIQPPDPYDEPEAAARDSDNTAPGDKDSADGAADDDPRLSDAELAALTR